MIPSTAETVVEIKARGGFYTPSDLTAFLSSWAIREESDRVLEPSCGDGAFISAASRRFAELGRADLAGHLYGVERNQREADKSRSLAPGAEILTLSFFDVEIGDLPAVDAVIGNPPYIRYHGFTGADRAAGLARAAAQGVELTQLASSWAHFVIHACAFLDEDHGRLGLVLPAELLHTDYAEPIRDYLTTRFGSVVVVAFDRNVFADAEVDAVLLLASNDDDLGMRLLRVHDVLGLSLLDVSPEQSAQFRASARRWSATIDADAASAYAGLVGSDRVVRMGDLASIDIGVVTGANDFFILTREAAESAKLPATALIPIVRRPADAKGLLVDPSEVALLIDLRGKPEPTDPHLLAYLGSNAEIKKRYKCRVRVPWYGVPLPKVKPDAFIPYMNHQAPRLIVNSVAAWSTNLIHGVAFKPGAPDPRALSAAMLSSITMLSSEIEGRAYGGGVLKLETKEAERLLVPKLTKESEAELIGLLPKLDQLVRARQRIQASALVDGALGVQHERLLIAWEAFRSRRIGRRKRG